MNKEIELCQLSGGMVTPWCLKELLGLVMEGFKEEMGTWVFKDGPVRQWDDVINCMVCHGYYQPLVSWVYLLASPSDNEVLKSVSGIYAPTCSSR